MLVFCAEIVLLPSEKAANISIRDRITAIYSEVPSYFATKFLMDNVETEVTDEY